MTAGIITDDIVFIDGQMTYGGIIVPILTGKPKLMTRNTPF